MGVFYYLCTQRIKDRAPTFKGLTRTFAFFAEAQQAKASRAKILCTIYNKKVKNLPI